MEVVHVRWIAGLLLLLLRTGVVVQMMAVHGGAAVAMVDECAVAAIHGAVRDRSARGPRKVVTGVTGVASVAGGIEMVMMVVVVVVMVVWVIRFDVEERCLVVC
jgi:acyl-coenzyme A thioesterase PaaI-like protein